jgi:ankyrin repeat protein
MLELGADPNKPTIYPTPGPVGNVRVNPAPPGSTPFHIAAQIRNVELTKLMFAHGANPNQLRQDGHSPFSVAVLGSNIDVMKAMVAGGADAKMLFNPTEPIADPVESKSEPRKNQTVLHLAAAAGASSIIEYLVSLDVPLEAVNGHGETAYQLADKQELFRWRRSIESANTDTLANIIATLAPAAAAALAANPGPPRQAPARTTQTTDAFKRAIASKTQQGQTGAQPTKVPTKASS